MPSLTLDLKHNSPRSRRILQAVSDRVQSSRKEYSKRHDQWRENEEAALAYIHESDHDRLRHNARDFSGRPQLTTLRIPYSYGVLMASHTYWTTVFLSRVPVMQFTGRHGESEKQTQALEALIDYQLHTGEMLVPLYLWLLDAGKYGLGVVNCNWSEEFSVVASIEEMPVLFAGLLPTGKAKKKKVFKRIPGYSGNRLTNIRPYDFFPDPRVPVRFFQKGEFCAARVEIGWNMVLKRQEQGYYIEETVKALRGRQGGSYTHIEGDRRAEGSPAVQLPTPETYFDDTTTHRPGSIPQNSVVTCFECCIELVPADWQLGTGTYPEKWVFTVTEDFTYVLGAQPLGAAHDRFPFAVLEYEPEGYALNSRGIGEVLKPVNDTMDWLINSHLYNVRKALNDQFVVDPSQVELTDLENPLPGGAIRLVPGAYGRDTRTALTQLPVQDVTRTHLSDLSALLSIGQRTVGVNDQLMGQIADTGRRSATEVRTGAGFGINRLKTISEFFSAMGWSPLAQMMVQNTQQHYDAEKKFRIVGQLAAEAGEGFIDVSPESILGFYDFVPVDGTQPVDRLAQAQLWQQLFGQLTNFPDLLLRYDIGRIFEWVAQLAGLKNVAQFRIEMTPEEQLLAEATKGNVIPIGGGQAGAGPGSSVGGASGRAGSTPGQAPGAPPAPITSSGGPGPGRERG